MLDYPKVVFMVSWTTEEQLIINNAQGKKYETVLKEIPDEKKRWKCHTCYTILKNSELIDKKCPVCGELHIVQMCPLDHNGCPHTIIDKIEFCPVCGKVLCPLCGDHSVVAISRVTGYLADVSGFGTSKKQELKDRVRTQNIESVLS
jgi:hypothetical protein